jgi:hypothetical protein
MVRTQKAKKLILSRDTLRRLSNTELRGVHGASEKRCDTGDCTILTVKNSADEKESCGQLCETSLDNDNTLPIGPTNDP